MKVRKDAALIGIFTSALLLGGLILGETRPVLISKVFAVAVLILNALMCLRTRKTPAVLLFSMILTYFNYSFCYMFYGKGQNALHDPHLIEMTLEWGTKLKGIAIVLFFNLILYIYMPKIKMQAGCFLKEFNKERKTEFFIIPIIAALIFVGIFGIERRSDADSYYIAISSLYEYSYILIVFALYCAKSRNWRIVIWMIAIMLCLQDLYYGGRVTTLQIGLVFVLLYGNKWVRIDTIILAMVAGLILFRAVSLYRISYSFENVIYDRLVKDTLQEGLALDTAYFAYHTSLGFVKSIGEASAGLRLRSMAGILMNSFGIKTSMMADSAHSIIKDLGYFTLGGGVMPIYFYFWMKIPSLLLFSLLIGKIFDKLGRWVKTSQYSDLAKLILIVIYATVPRWYLYTPLIFFKTSLFLIPLLWVILKIGEAFVYRNGRICINIRKNF